MPPSNNHQKIKLHTISWYTRTTTYHPHAHPPIHHEWVRNDKNKITGMRLRIHNKMVAIFIL
ncbi:hypothetical protein [Actinopolyspora halophila]|uniref:hypothetical protein n=1 Tax=Actinopolyspora halophila TaxID=1850 RepID=UPI00036E4E88|nr:hypothetical protein [Actinopolyspora halophila]